MLSCTQCHQDAAKTDDIRRSNTLQSKFARWFPEEGKLYWNAM